MGSFGDIGLAYQFSIALVCLIFVTFVAAFIRLFWTKKRLAHNQKRQDIEAAEIATKRTVTEIGLGEGDLFGVRAIEKGFYGGVAQSTPSSAATSPRLSPVSTITVGSVSPVSTSPSRGSSIPELSLPGPSFSQSPSNFKSLSTNPSGNTLRLQPSDAELNGRRNHDPTVVLSTYKPNSPVRPEAAERSQSYPIPDMQISVNHKAQSYAQWRLSADIRRTARVIPKAENGISSMRSEAASIIIDGNMHQHNGCPTSHSLSLIEENQIRELQQRSDAIKVVDKVSPLTKTSERSSEPSTNSSRRRSGFEYLENNHHRNASTISARSIKSLRQIKKFSVGSIAARRQSRQRERTPYGSSSSSTSSSSSRSRSRSTEASSASSVKSQTESLEDVPKQVNVERCDHCRNEVDVELKQAGTNVNRKRPTFTRLLTQ